MEDSRKTALIIARNLRALMTHHGLSQAQLAHKTGCAQRTLSTLLNVERPLEINPTARTIDALCDYFHIEPWQLLIPEIPLELLTNSRLAKLIENYKQAPEIGRASVERVAESEVRYSAISGKKHS